MKKLSLPKLRLNRKARIGLLIAVSILIAGWLVLYMTREILLDKAISKIKARLRNKYGIELTLKTYKLEGWSHLEMKGILLLSASKDTLAWLNEARLDARVLPVLVGKIRFSSIKAEEGTFNLSRIIEIRSKTSEKTVQTDTTKFGRIKKYIHYAKEISAMLPSDFLVKNISASYDDSVDHLRAYVDSMSYKDQKLVSILRMTIKGKKQNWQTSGTFDKSTLESHMSVETDDTSFYSFNFIRALAKADIGFKNFKFDLEKLDETSDEIRVSGAFSGRRVFLINPRLSEDKVVIENGSFRYNILMTKELISLEGGTACTLNDIEGKITGEYRFRDPSNVKFSVEMPPVDAQSFINSMPGGTFDQTKGMQMLGKFAYKLNFYLDLDRKDTIKVNSDLDGFGLRIMKYGKAVLSKLNTTFIYYPYNSKRPIAVGPENPEFASIDQISPYLKNAVLTSEDPSFFWHHGFVEEALEQSFLENIKAGKFRRGGSTISMQLVKNVFLSHRKTIDRKVEEAFLVWLIENMHLCSKSRMFEVYLNIIEWGPNIYGIGEASRFYFNKTPAALSLNESIYLALLIPKPLAFAWRFDDAGHLKGYMQAKSRFIASLMRYRGMISDSTFASYWPDVNVIGAGRRYLKIVPQHDTLNPADTLESDELF